MVSCFFLCSFPGDELRKQLQDSKARFILTVGPLKEVAEKAVEGTSVEVCSPYQIS